MNVVIDEPVELRDRMRSLAAVAPDQVRAQLVREVAIIAAEAVPSALTPGAAGIDLEAVCGSYQRELWLWLVGERTWAQCVSGLGGRLLRRSTATQAG
jgi:hypothetical protein